MNPKSKKKIEDFKKEIKKEAFERKKAQIRKELPYYQEFFNQIEESSNATNSRSSRFPIRSGSSKEKSHTFGGSKAQKSQQYQTLHENSYEQQKQIKYLQYLRNLNSTFQPQDKELVEKSMTQRFGSQCFQNIQNLRTQIYYDLLAYQTETYQNHNNSTFIEQFTSEDWNFVIASYKFAQNENFQQILRSSFSLMTGLFNQWYFDKMQQSINYNKNNPITFVFDKMKEIQETEIGIHEIILSTLMKISQYEIDSQIFMKITQYFIDKIQVFENLEKQLLRHYEVEETEKFSQFIFNFGFIHAMETLACSSQNQETDIHLRISMYNVVNRYFTMYPVNVDSEIQTQQKFNLFIFNYLNNLSSFFQLIQHQKEVDFVISLEDPLFQFMKSSQSLIHSLLWRETEQSCNYQILIIYRHLINICLTTDGLIVQVFGFKDFHTRMIEFSVCFFAFIQGGQVLLTQNGYMHYVSLLIYYFHEAKLKFRNNLSNCMQSNNSISKQNQLCILQVYLIYALYIIKNVSKNIQNGHIRQDVQKLLQYTEFVYRKEYNILQQYNNQTAQNFYLIFYENVKLYFRLFLNPAKNQIQNFEKQQNSNHFSQQIEL